MPCHFPNKHVIFNEGDGSPCLYVLLSGKVSLQTKIKGLIYTLYPGDVFGEIGLISQIKRSATATCEVDSSLLRIESDKFNLILGKFPRISSIIMRNITIGLSNHISRMNKHEIVDYIPNKK
jgi:CRP-like cAMP-binding protein